MDNDRRWILVRWSFSLCLYWKKEVKKLLIFLLLSLGFISGFISGLLISSFTMSLLSFGEGFTLWITLICVYIWGTRNDKDGFYRLFKDTHQSNLDDIERQELEEQEAEVIQ
jgi:hypothetical protein